MERWRRYSTLLFLGAGAVLAWGWQQLNPVTPVVLVSEARWLQANTQFSQQVGRAPSPREQQTLRQQLAQEALLHQWALSQHLDQTRVVRERLQLLGEYLDSEVERTWALHSDPLIRRYLVEAARQQLIDQWALPTWSEERLATAYQERLSEFYRPARYRLEQRYFGGLEATSRARAEQARAALLRGDTVAGEPFSLGQRWPQVDADTLSRQLGGDWQTALAQLEEGEWSQPLASAYGWHLLRIEQRWPAQVAEFDEVRPQLMLGLYRQWQEQRLSEWIEQQLAHSELIAPALSDEEV